MSPNTLLKSWSPCTSCALHSTSNKQVLYRGKFPSKILVIGDAPGKGETAVGKPFVGSRGKLLEHLLQEAFNEDATDLTLKDVVFTTFISCVPWATPETRQGYRPPSSLETQSCSPRLEAVFHQTQPKLIFLTGIIAASLFSSASSFFVSRKEVPPTLCIPSPFFLTYKGNSPTSIRKTTEYTDALISIRNFLRENYHG